MIDVFCWGGGGSVALLLTGIVAALGPFLLQRSLIPF